MRRGFVDEIRLPLAAFVGEPCGRATCHGGRVMTNALGSRKCPDCKGTGNVGGIAAQIFAAHPVTKVVLTGDEGSEPPHDGGVETLPDGSPSPPQWWHWVRVPEPGGGPLGYMRWELPPAIYDRLPGGGSYRSEDEALEARSVALVRWGRSLVPWLRAADAAVSRRW